MSAAFAAALMTLVITVQASAALAQDRGQITFNRDVAPILVAHCASCHRPGGAAPFSLHTYDDARRRATLLADVVGRRYMPPWKPEPGYGDFADARRLTDHQIALVQRWVNDGAVEGDAAAPSPPQRSDAEWELGPPDLVVSLPEPYALQGEASDVFRTFVVPVRVDSRKYVRAVSFRPGSRSIHHANLKVDATASSRMLDAGDPEPGYEGAGGRGARFPDGHFLGWTPGQTPRVFPDGLAWRLDAGSDLVIELHLAPVGKAERIQPSVALYFTDRPPARQPYMIRIGRQDIDIPANSESYVSTDSYRLPVDVEVLAVQPHAHQLARTIEGFAVRPDGTTEWLIRINDWDMNWQDVYRFREPLRLPKGTLVTMRYAYDNSTANVKNPNTPPRRITFGQTTASEMGDLWLQVLPLNPGDLEVLDRDFVPKMLRDDIAGVEKVLEQNPDDARVHADLAFCYLDAGRVDDAVAQLAEAARLEPHSATRQYDLGRVELRNRAFAAARAAFNEAIRLDPGLGEAYNELGVVSHAEGDLVAAIRWYRRALEVKPSNAAAMYNLARALASQGDAAGALASYRDALRADPDDAQTHASLAALLSTRQDVDGAVSHYRRALALDPDQPAALVDLAWLLATSGRSDLGGALEAVRLAERASSVTNGRSATVLDTLAVAYAAAGDWRGASETASRALEIATSSGNLELSDRIRARLEVYRQRHAEEPRHRDQG